MNEAIKRLKSLISEISERCYSAGWMDGTEFVLWRALREGPMGWGHGTITEGDIEALKRMSEKAGGWIVWDDETEETYRSMSQWLLIYALGNTPVHGRWDVTAWLENSDRCK